MPFQESTASVTTSATALGSNGLQGRARMFITPGGSVWVGSSTVTPGTGFALSSNSNVDFAAPQDQKVYAVAAAGTVTVRVLEVG